MGVGKPGIRRRRPSPSSDNGSEDKASNPESNDVEAEEPKVREATPSRASVSKLAKGRGDAVASAGSAKVSQHGERKHGRMSQVTVTIGSETFSPFQYNSFTTPAISVTFEVEYTDDLADVVDNAVKQIRTVQTEQFKPLFDDHVRKVKENAMRAGGQ